MFPNPLTGAPPRKGPAKCPDTGRPFKAMVVRPGQGLVPVYGYDDFNWYSLLKVIDGKTYQYHYDARAGCWFDDPEEVTIEDEEAGAGG